MTIGHITIKKFNETDVLFEIDITDFAVTGGKAFISLTGSFISDLPLVRGNVYSASITGEVGNINFDGIFEDYTFNAGASDYYDQEGVHHSGIVTLSNRIQFRMI